MIQSDRFARQNDAEDRLLAAAVRGNEAGAVLAAGELAGIMRGMPSQELRAALYGLNMLLRKKTEGMGIPLAELQELYMDLNVQIHVMTYDDAAAAITALASRYASLVRSIRMGEHLSPLVVRVIRDVTEHLSSPLTLHTVAEACHVSPAYLSGQFHEEMGVTFTAYVTTCRMDRAAELLMSTDQPVSIVAMQTGILDVNYFSRLFKKHKGISPTDFRKVYRYAAEQE